MIEMPIRDNQVVDLATRKHLGLPVRVHVIGLKEYLFEYKDFVCVHDVRIKFENNGTANQNGG